MSRDELQKNVRRYELELPENWKAPAGLVATQTRTSPDGRDAQWTIIGDERDVAERLTSSGANVREAQPLAFEEAALALLSGERAQ
jgi:hypothetical protein